MSADEFSGFEDLSEQPLKVRLVGGQRVPLL